MLLVAIALPARAQDLLWFRGHGRDHHPTNLARSFGDLDRDGYQDLLCSFEFNAVSSGPRDSMLVLSGRDGAVLDSNQTLGRGFVWADGVGDFDLDGYPDYGVVVSSQPYYLVIWSPHLHQQLLRINNFTGRPVVSMQIDGDGLPDLVSVVAPNDIQAFDRFGQPIWSFPLAGLGLTVRDLLAFPDLDGDGVGEILVGSVDGLLTIARGSVAVLSGRRGTLLRIAYDGILGDLIGTPLARAGDVDGDGVEDYATGSYLGGVFSRRSVLDVFSGATGALLHEWATPYDLATSLVGGHDVDQDGRPDLIAGSTSYPISNFRLGRAQAFSPRDHQLLMHVEPSVDTYNGGYAINMADLGVQPGNPYPVFAVLDYYPAIPYSYLEVWRCAPAGSVVSGPGCTNVGEMPTIGVRRVDTNNGEQSRVVLGSARPGGWAFCVAAGAAETAYGGINVPFALDGLGFAGCTLLVPPTFSEQRTVGVTGVDRGYTAIDLPFRIDAAGFGAALQWLILDRANGAYATTPRFEVHLQ